MRYAVIIKHPYRDSDYRVDVVEADENADLAIIQRIIQSEMLGPFEVIAITPKYNPSRDISKGLDRINRETEKHIDT